MVTRFLNRRGTSTDAGYYNSDTWMYEAFAAQELERARRMQEAWQAFHGELDPALKVERGLPDDNVYANMCKMVVNTTVAFLFGKPVDFLIEGQKRSKNEDGTPNVSPEQQWLDEVWKRNRKQSLLQKLGQNGAVCGHAYLKITIKDGWPKLRVLDPANVCVYYEDDDYESVYAYKIQWNGFDRSMDLGTGLRRNKMSVFRQRIEKADDGQSWEIIDEVSHMASTTPTPGTRRSPSGTLLNLVGYIGWEERGRETWPYPFSPIKDCQNLILANDYYGLPDLDDDVINMQRSINETLSNTNRILRIYAHPKAWTSGLTPEQVATISASPSGLINLPDPDSSLHLLEMQSDLGSSDKHFVRLRETFHELTEIPEIATGKLEDLGRIAGVTLQILYGPLASLTTKKQETYGPTLEDLNGCMLALQGHGSYEEPIRVHNNWPEFIPADPLAEAQVSVLQKQFGASERTLLQKAGFDPDTEFRQRQEEEEKKAKMAAEAAQLLGEATQNDEEEGEGPGAPQERGGRNRPERRQRDADRDNDGVPNERRLGVSGA